MPRRSAILSKAIRYFGIVFTLAFVLGVARVLVIAPRIGATGAVLLEVPIVLAASWLVARHLLRNRPFGTTERLAVGAIAFALLMASEALLATAMLGQTLGEWAAAVATPLGLIGLAGQLGFAAIPLLVPRGRTT